MVLHELLSEWEAHGLQNDADQSDKLKKYLNITRDTGEFLSVLVKAIKARTILEIGTSNGYSTLWLASSLLARGQVYTIEKNEAKAAEAKRNFERAGLLYKITQLVGDVRSELAKVPQNVDMIFLDADRSLYLSLAEKLFDLLNTGGLLVCDNAVSHESELTEFVDWVRPHKHLSVSLVPVGKGELLVYKGSK
ncbi:O-methyltransferase [Desulfosarcina alkanivorans]|jgi:predicted O-methyltransferase YrrM|uniref:O-methyltransferase n=1 Tax=Desulfosarcina alkanivorans TaxID=571177 RepID=A0A5K7YYN0_9BACT|nr:O-methyltransferase [Desulfosarcina alkanivorans]BBO71434.1 O-methyltransferase [Desulfosarcina alkanivorans]